MDASYEKKRGRNKRKRKNQLVCFRGIYVGIAIRETMKSERFSRGVDGSSDWESSRVIKEGGSKQATLRNVEKHARISKDFL